MAESLSLINAIPCEGGGVEALLHKVVDSIGGLSPEFGKVRWRKTKLCFATVYISMRNCISIIRFPCNPHYLYPYPYHVRVGRTLLCVAYLVNPIPPVALLARFRPAGTLFHKFLHTSRGKEDGHERSRRVFDHT
jgi:hypothetical protein